MADFQNTTDIKTNTFSKGMVKDLNESFVGEGLWTHARNATKNTHLGQVGTLGNEQANRFVSQVPYSFIGAIYLTEDRWALFSTNNLDSEIGLFDESAASYTTLVNARCLNFNTAYLVIGVSKSNHDCTRSIYWDDGLNPSRVLNIDRVPYKQKAKSRLRGKSCNVPEYTQELDCEKLRLERLMQLPTLTLKKGTTGGNLPNGSYQVVVAYTVNGIRVTDYFTPSNVQSLFSHENMHGSVELEIADMDESFDEFELVLVSNFNQQTAAKKVGNYSTRTRSVYIDRWDQRWTSVPLEWIPLQTPSYEKSNAMYDVNGYLLRVGVYNKPDFNYQPLANQIRAKWVAAEFPANYYHKGGNLTSYMRDENYVFFIRWVDNTGKKSSSYPIPGRPAEGSDLTVVTGPDVIELQDKDNLPDQPVRKWESENTAKVTATAQYALPEGGRVIAEGEMGYAETTEIYPDDKPDVWGALCGQPQRLHKMPDNSLVHIHNQGGDKIVLLGVKFENILHPLGSDGEPIPNIVGYEILRGSREGNKTVIAKGLLNNTGEYDIPNGITERKGLYPNYPYNDLRTDPFLSQEMVKGGCQGKGYKAMGKFRKDVFTFHSPETQFRNPFLNATELKIHTEQVGKVQGAFESSFKHPRHKLIRDFSLLVSGLAGVGTGMLALRGKKTTITTSPRNFYWDVTTTGSPTVSGRTANTPGVPAVQGRISQTVLGVMKLLLKETLSTVPASAAAYDVATKLMERVDKQNEKTKPTSGVGLGGQTTVQTEGTAYSELPTTLKLAGGTFMFTYFFAQGTEQALRIIRSVIPYQQYAYQYNSHGFYGEYREVDRSNRRRLIKDAVYLDPYLQEFSNYRVNNLFRSRQVILETNEELENPSVTDDTRQTIGSRQQWDDPTRPFSTTTSAYYASLKVKMKNQYGQLESVIQLPVSTGVHKTEAVKVKKHTSPVLFGGDVYINRYTEKNPFFLFNDWMMDQPDGFEMDYRLHMNVPYPRYWIDTREYDVSQLTSSLMRLNFKGDVLPNDLAHLDRRKSDCNTKVSFVINNAYFYLFVNGVRDFFCESEMNMAQRDWGETQSERHYDPERYTDLKALFRADVIKAGNYFKYDNSLSISKLLHNYISWGSLLPRDYNPLVYEQCYAYQPNRVIYSLPQVEELKKDNWSAFLANNYKDFDREITCIKPVGKSGALILFRDDAPVQFQGVDQLQTDSGVKITIGDGGLFTAPMQNVGNADINYEYGSCQNRLSVLNTPAGLFWVSQDQGKIFHFTGGMDDISRKGMKWWFAKYLPSQLLKDFPQFELRDNPVMGIGVTAVYDNTNETVYFSKKDFKLREEYKGRLLYTGRDTFRLDSNVPVKLGDPTFFEDASFTVSYDVKDQTWVSYHDWHPDYVLPSKNRFLTVKNSQLWKHNDRTDRYCEFYGTPYPFEVEYPVSSGQDVNTIRSLEYMLECYQYFNDGQDSFHILDENFDRAIIYNSEQISGLLRLNPIPKNNPLLMSEYPRVINNGVDILFSKEENKYRINQFWDVTKDRGEFSGRSIPMFVTEPNGYIKQINRNYVNYLKKDIYHKKFRHQNNRILLRKTVSNDVKMLLKIANTKQLKSFR